MKQLLPILITLIVIVWPAMQAILQRAAAKRSRRMQEQQRADTARMAVGSTPSQGMAKQPGRMIADTSLAARRQAQLELLRQRRIQAVQGVRAPGAQARSMPVAPLQPQPQLGAPVQLSPGPTVRRDAGRRMKSSQPQQAATSRTTVPPGGERSTASRRLQPHLEEEAQRRRGRTSRTSSATPPAEVTAGPWAGLVESLQRHDSRRNALRNMIVAQEILNQPVSMRSQF